MDKKPYEMKTGSMIWAGIGWGLVLVLALLYGLKYHSADVFGNSVKKSEILSRMKINMLKSAELEKAAVIAVTDKESEDFAKQSLKAADDTEHDLRELDSLIASDNETKLLKEFHICWKDFREIDKVLLDFAVQNTNLKAAGLSYSKGAEFIRWFEILITNLTENCNDARIIKPAYQAMTALLKIHNLEYPHINESDDKQMDEIEAVMKAQENHIRIFIKAISDMITDEPNRALLDEASAVFAEFMKVNAEVIRLSRLNTNIRSAELSMGRKRKTVARCEEILTSMQEAVRSESGFLSKGLWGKFR